MSIVANSELWNRPVSFINYDQYFSDIQDHTMFSEKTAIVAEDRSKLFGIHNSKSFFITHEEAVEKIYNASTELFGVEPDVNITSVKDGSKIRAKFSCPEYPSFDIGGGDINDVQIILDKNYEKQSGFNVLLGAYRYVCSNGAVIGKTVGGFNSKQVIDEGFSETTLEYKIKKMVEDAQRLADIWKSWKDIYVTKHDLKYNVLMGKFPEKFIDKIFDSISTTSGDVDLWSLYNAFTAQSTHNSRTSSSQMTLDDRISSLFYSYRSNIRDYDKEIFGKREEVLEEELEEV